MKRLTGYKYAVRGACGLYPNRYELVVLKNTRTRETITLCTGKSFVRTIYADVDGTPYAFINGKYHALRYSLVFDAYAGRKRIRTIDYQRTPLNPYQG